MNGELLHIEGTSVTWKGREIKSPAPRAAAFAAGVLITSVLGLVLGFLLPVLLPVLLAVHTALYAAGRRGFVYRDADGTVQLEVPEGAMTRRSEQRAG
jgi:hypothetical protein